MTAAFQFPTQHAIDCIIRALSTDDTEEEVLYQILSCESNAVYNFFFFLSFGRGECPALLIS